MKRKTLSYDKVVTIENLMDVYKTVRNNTRHKEKIFVFELFFSCNIISIYNILKSEEYKHGKYNIFIIKEPKYRLIMSECMPDKIINHLISTYFLFPLIDPLLLPMNVATRPLMGSDKGIYYIKKYINKLKYKNDKIYVLKCDIAKYFYSIDQEILLEKLSDLIDDEKVFNLVKEVIISTNNNYVNECISKSVNREIERLGTLPIIDYQNHVKELKSIPLYQKGKGLPIGNMTSQILAVYYLNDLDHYIKEKLRIKYYVRYMDDFILFHEDREYLKYCLGEIEKKLAEVKLKLNKKTQILEIHHGFCFLGYRFILKDKKLLMLLSSSTKKRLRKRVKYVRENKPEMLDKTLASYNGYLNRAASGSFRFRHDLKIKK